jgi:hypothetical protein
MRSCGAFVPLALIIPVVSQPVHGASYTRGHALNNLNPPTISGQSTRYAVDLDGDGNPKPAPPLFDGSETLHFDPAFIIGKFVAAPTDAVISNEAVATNPFWSHSWGGFLKMASRIRWD